MDVGDIIGFLYPIAIFIIFVITIVARVSKAMKQKEQQTAPASDETYQYHEPDEEIYNQKEYTQADAPIDGSPITFEIQNRKQDT